MLDEKQIQDLMWDAGKSLFEEIKNFKKDEWLHYSIMKPIIGNIK